MTIDLRSREFQVELQNAAGGNALDVSSVVKSFTVSNSQLDESGLILTTGTLILHAYPLTPLAESLNPKLNPTRFARKCRVSVQIGDESGNLVLHPRGLLRILKTPKVPSYTNPEIQIQVGCLLSLQDYRQPASDDSGVEPGTPKTRAEIINALAALAKISNLEEEIPEWPIDYPLPRLNGSYVQQMGAIAFAAGYTLWIDNQERLRAKRIPQNPTPDLTLIVGQNDSVFEPLEGSETPCEIIHCTCTYPKVIETVDPKPFTAISRDSKYSPSDITFQFWTGMGTRIPYSYRRSRRPRALVMPDKFPNSKTLTNAEVERSRDYFEDTERGFLIRRVQDIHQPVGALMPQFYPGDFQQIIGVRNEMRYTYSQEGVINRITQYTYEPQGVINPDKTRSATRTRLGLSAYETTIYRRTNNGWTKNVSRRSFKVGDSSPSSGTTFSASGDNQPPAPEQQQQPYYLEDTQITAKARYSEIGGSFDERKRTFEVQTASTKAQLKFLAGLIGQRVWGQVNGSSFGFDLRDEFNGDAYEPLQVVDWVEFDDGGRTYYKSRYLVVGEAFALSDRQCAIAADGLYLGRIVRRRTDGSPTPPSSPINPSGPDETEYLETPYEEIDESEGNFALVGGFTVYPYDTSEPTSETLEGGVFGLIGRLAEQEPLSGFFGLVGSIMDAGAGELTLLHSWSLDDSSWADSLGSSDLTASGTVINVAGQVNNCAEFDGSSYLYSEDSANISFEGSWKLTLQVYLPDPIGSDSFVAGSDGQWSLYFEGSSLLFSIITTDFYLDLYSSASIAWDTWYTMTVEISGSTASITVDETVDNGELDSPIAPAGTFAPFQFRLGRVEGRGSIYNGSKIDEVELYGES